MEPALRHGDWLVAMPPRTLRRGAVVVVEHPERPGLELVKRLVGLPGDVIGALVLGPDQHWVLGDRPEASTDSRWFGPVASAGILGVVVFRYRPLSRMGRLRGSRPG